MIDTIQINKFSHLHDGKNIIFCKTDYILNEFEYIKKLNNDVVLITGNSDYPITDNLTNKMPSNIKKWFAQNAISNNPKLVPIPIGIENREESIRKGHGVSYFDRVSEKENIISDSYNGEIINLVYSNFNIHTNFAHRSQLKKISMESSDIIWDEPNLKLSDFFLNTKKYEYSICPAGNGVDTHRLWEVLYCNRIPITIKLGNYKIYDLYKKLPIIVLDNVNELLDIENIKNKKNEISFQNIEMLGIDYWIKLILNEL
jgi:hypothetical protein